MKPIQTDIIIFSLSRDRILMLHHYYDRSYMHPVSRERIQVNDVCMLLKYNEHFLYSIN